MPFRLIIATSASFADYPMFRDKLDHLLQNKQEVEICSGFSLAGDTLTDTYSAERPVTVKKFDPGFRGMYRALVYAEAALFFHDGASAGITKYIQEARDCKLRVKVVTFVPNNVRTNLGTESTNTTEVIAMSPKTPIDVGNSGSAKLRIPPNPTTTLQQPYNPLNAAITAGKPRPRNQVVVDGEVLTAKTKAPRKKKAIPAGDSTWKARYQQAHKENFKQQFPHAHRDGHYIEPIYPKVRESNGMQTAIVNYLNWMGHRAKRINNMGRLVDGVDVTESGAKITAKKWIPSAAGRGQSDVSSTLWGKSVQLEIKAGNDKPSADQLKEQAKERKAGGIYEFIFSIEAFFELYDKLFTLYGSSINLFQT